jgi:hypothetical protein
VLEVNTLLQEALNAVRLALLVSIACQATSSTLATQEHTLAGTGLQAPRSALPVLEVNTLLQEALNAAQLALLDIIAGAMSSPLAALVNSLARRGLDLPKAAFPAWWGNTLQWRGLHHIQLASPANRANTVEPRRQQYAHPVMQANILFQVAQDAALFVLLVTIAQAASKLLALQELTPVRKWLQVTRPAFPVQQASRPMRKRLLAPRLVIPARPVLTPAHQEQHLALFAQQAQPPMLKELVHPQLALLA